MTGASTSLTASADDEAPNDTPHDINIAPAAFVEWDGGDQGQTQQCLTPDPPARDVTFEIQVDATARLAFFRLAIPVMPRRSKKPTFFYAFIPPEQILELGHDKSCISDKARVKLGSGTVCLRFRLDQPPTIVVPNSGLLAMRKASQDVLRAVKTLARQTSVAVFIPVAALSHILLSSLCQAVSNHRFKTLPGLADIAGLYVGEGGKILSLVTGPVGSPPSYDELGPGPPSAGKLLPIKKRRRDDGSALGQTDIDPKLIESVCTKFLEVKMIELRQSHQRDLEAQAAELRAEHRRDLDEMTQRFQEHKDWVEKRLDMLRENVQDALKDEVADLITDEVAARTSDLEEHLEDLVADEILSAEEKIKSDLTEATVLIQFN